MVRGREGEIYDGNSVIGRRGRGGKTGEEEEEEEEDDGDGDDDDESFCFL